MKHYPDLTENLAQKTRGRLMLARLSFAEKLTIHDRLRENANSFGSALRAATASLQLSRSVPKD